MTELKMPVICECGFNTMDARKAVEHARSHARYIIIRCPGCHSEIAIMPNEKNAFDIDCDCGQVITPDKYDGEFEYVV